MYATCVIRLLTWNVHLTYLFYKWLHLGYIMIVFFLVMWPVFCVAPEMLYYWYRRNPRMLDVLSTEPFLPQGFHWIISASWRGGICRLGNGSSSIDTYPDFTNWRKAVERTLQLRRSASKQHGKQTYTCFKSSPQLAWSYTPGAAFVDGRDHRFLLVAPDPSRCAAPAKNVAVSPLDR